MAVIDPNYWTDDSLKIVGNLPLEFFVAICTQTTSRSAKEVSIDKPVYQKLLEVLFKILVRKDLSEEFQVSLRKLVDQARKVDPLIQKKPFLSSLEYF